jgi:Tol biopolymer transport system component
VTGDWFLSASADTLVYAMGKRRDSQLTWFNRAGRALGTVGEPGVYYDPAVSPDGAMLAVEQGDAVRGTTDLWIGNLARCAFSRLTSAPGFEDVATWSPDGRIAFASDQGPSPKTLVKNASGTGAEDVVVEADRFPWTGRATAGTCCSRPAAARRDATPWGADEPGGGRGVSG